MDQLVGALLAGIASGMPVFLVGSGLALIFGAMGVLNFAHGGLVMLGAYLLFSVLGGKVPTSWAFVLAIAISVAVTAAISLVAEQVAFRRIYSLGREALPGLLMSFGLLQILIGVAPVIWGPLSVTQSGPSFLGGFVTIFSTRVATYNFLLLGVGIVVAAGLYVLLQRTTYGRVITAVSHDRLVASTMGISVKRVSATVFVIAGGLAALAGALIAPQGSIDTTISDSYLFTSFLAMAIGGPGSIVGSFVGAVVLSVVNSLFATYDPTLQPYAEYLVVFAVLLFRPHGLFAPRLTAREA